MVSALHVGSLMTKLLDVLIKNVILDIFRTVDAYNVDISCGSLHKIMHAS